MVENEYITNFLTAFNLSVTNRPTINHHSCHIGLDEKGRVELGGASSLNQFCYVDITHGDNACDRFIAAQHPFVLRESSDVDSVREYVNFILNSNMFGRGFITKDCDEGFKSGFEIDTSLNRTYLLTCLSFLRWPFEDKSECRWSWATFRNLGYTEIQSLFLARCLSIVYDKTGSTRIFREQCKYYGGHVPFKEKPLYSFYKKRWECFDVYDLPTLDNYFDEDEDGYIPSTFQFFNLDGKEKVEMPLLRYIDPQNKTKITQLCDGLLRQGE